MNKIALNELNKLFLESDINPQLYDKLKSIVSIASQPEKYDTSVLPNIAELIIIETVQNTNIPAIFFDTDFFKINLKSVIPKADIKYWYRLNVPTTNLQPYKKVRKYTKNVGTLQVCLDCKKEYTISFSGQKFCCVKCRQNHKNNKRIEQRKTEKLTK